MHATLQTRLNFVLHFLSAILLYGQESEFARLDSLSKIHIEDSLAFPINKRYLSLAIENDNNYHQAQALSNLAIAYLISDDYGQALELMLEALEKAKRANDETIMAIVYTTFGWLYYDVGDVVQAEAYHKLALEHWNPSSDSLAICTSLNAVGLAIALGGRNKEALDFYKNSLKIGYKIKNEERILVAMNNIGDALHLLNSPDEALHWLEKSQIIAHRHPDVLREAEVLNSIANVLISLNRFNDAEVSLIESRNRIAQSRSNARKEFLMRNAYISAMLYKSTGDFDQAFSALELHDSLRNQILSDEKKGSLAERMASWQASQREAEIDQLKKERELRITQRNTIAVGIILLSLAGFFLYSRERQLRVKEHQLAETREALTTAELEKSQLEKEALNTKLEFKNKELTNYALHISQRNDLQRAFLDELELFKSKASPDLLVQLNRAVKQFGTHEVISKEVEEFHVNIELENKDFFFNLTQRFPELTENEKRLCAQVRLNLSIKDIASVNNISVKAVEMARYRLRKKMNVPHDANLIDFLNKI